MSEVSPSAPFEKWEGLGNDFIVFGPDTPVERSTDRLRELCDRRRGVGADGVLVIEAESGERPRMTVYNADGSRPEMCGNGLRCVAAFLDQARRSEPSGSADSAARELVIDTDAGAKRCLIRGEGPDRYDVEVEMGTARIGGELRASIRGREHHFVTVDVGNPHAITFEPYEEAEIDEVGPIVATSVPLGTNVEFCRVRAGSNGEPTRISVVVWERGVGRTLACGTGACAVAAAACAAGRACYGEPMIISLPGGDLEVTVGAERRDLTMRGPARRVFTGEVRRP